MRWDENSVVGNDGDSRVWFEVWCSILWGCVEKERKEGSDNWSQQLNVKLLWATISIWALVPNTVLFLSQLLRFKLTSVNSCLHKLSQTHFLRYSCQELPSPPKYTVPAYIALSFYSRLNKSLRNKIITEDKHNVS